MARRSRTRQLRVLMNGQHVGTWTVIRSGHSFRYAEDWLSRSDARPVSLSMPLRPSNQPYQDDRVEAYFDNLLPDSIDIRRRIQAQVGAQSLRPFDLLAEIGRDCVGAVQLQQPDQPPGEVNRIDAQALTESELANAIASAVSTPTLGQQVDDVFRISLAGAQEKTAFLRHQGQWYKPLGATPTTHIMKLPLGRVGTEQLDLSTSVDNEWLCSRLVRAFGLAIARCEIGRFEDRKVLVVERFDRRLSKDGRWWMRLPQEDMCQVTATPPALKYESDGGPGIERIMRLLLGSRRALADRSAFMKTQIVFWLLCAPDGHAKNFSVFIEAGGRYSMTPLYDVISAYPVLGRGKNKIAAAKVRLAMAMLGQNKHYRWREILPRHIMETAHKTGFGGQIGTLVDEIAAIADTAVQQVASQLPKQFPDSVATPILEGVLRQARRLPGKPLSG